MRITTFISLILISQILLAQADVFKPGTTIKKYGQIAVVSGMEPIPDDVKFKVSFDVYKAAKPGEINRSLDSVARFINMHAANGVPLKNIKLAVVIHGGAVKEMAQNSYYLKQFESNNANTDLIAELQKYGVAFYVCGQSAAYYGVTDKDLLPGVKMSLSAMTAHALLQQQGFTLNPF
jgi:intracellular sulfur oxidation DsrE/DsrF family protein